MPSRMICQKRVRHGAHSYYLSSQSSTKYPMPERLRLVRPIPPSQTSTRIWSFSSVAQPAVANMTSEETQTIDSTLPKRGPFFCEDCKKLFQFYSEFVRHRRVHTGERPFKCSTCNREFARKSDLTKHFRVHTGERPFACPTCGKRFSQRSDMNKHKSVHDKPSTYRCSCGKQFLRESAFNRHLKQCGADSPEQLLQIASTGSAFSVPLKTGLAGGTSGPRIVIPVARSAVHTLPVPPANSSVSLSPTAKKFPILGSDIASSYPQFAAFNAANMLINPTLVPGMINNGMSTIAALSTPGIPAPYMLSLTSFQPITPNLMLPFPFAK